MHAPPNTHVTIKHHQNIRYTWLAFPLYSMKHQVKMRDLCWISCFCCFSVCFSLFRCFSWKPQWFSYELFVSFWVRSFFRKTKNYSDIYNNFCENSSTDICTRFIVIFTCRDLSLFSPANVFPKIYEWTSLTLNIKVTSPLLQVWNNDRLLE